MELREADMATALTIAALTAEYALGDLSGFKAFMDAKGASGVIQTADAGMPVTGYESMPIDKLENDMSVAVVLFGAMAMQAAEAAMDADAAEAADLERQVYGN